MTYLNIIDSNITLTTSDMQLALDRFFSNNDFSDHDKSHIIECANNIVEYCFAEINNEEVEDAILTILSYFNNGRIVLLLDGGADISLEYNEENGEQKSLHIPLLRYEINNGEIRRFTVKKLLWEEIN